MLYKNKTLEKSYSCECTTCPRCLKVFKSGFAVFSHFQKGCYGFLKNCPSVSNCENSKLAKESPGHMSSFPPVNDSYHKQDKQFFETTTNDVNRSTMSDRETCSKAPSSASLEDVVRRSSNSNTLPSKSSHVSHCTSSHVSHVMSVERQGRNVTLPLQVCCNIVFLNVVILMF